MKTAKPLFLITIALASLGLHFSVSPAIGRPVEIPVSGAWSFSSGPEFPGASGDLEMISERSGRLSFNFEDGGAYVAAYCQFEQPLDPERFLLSIQKPAEAYITVRITDATGQSHQKSTLFDRSELVPVEIGMDGWTGHWGGANDGVVHFPLRNFGILTESRGLSEPTGTILFRNLRMIPAGPGRRPAGVLKQRYRVSEFLPREGFQTRGPIQRGEETWAIDFSKGTSASLRGSASLFGRPEQLYVTLDSDQAGVEVVLRMGSHFQGFERVLGRTKGGVETFSVPSPAEGWRYYGGENDGIVRMPLRVTEIVLRGDESMGMFRLGELFLEAETAVPSDQSVFLQSSLRFDPDREDLVLDCSAWNLSSAPRQGLVELALRDWDERVLFSRVEDWAGMPGAGERQQRSWRIPWPGERNFFEATVRFVPDEHPAVLSRATWTSPDVDAGDPGLDPESPWGMGVYLYRYGHDAEGHAKMDRAAAMAQAAGVKWSREEFGWARIEPKEGEYDFSFYDVVVDTALRHGISVYGLLSYWSSWTEPYTEEGIEDFCRWARQVVLRYKDRVHHWEVYNEPNIFFWQGPKELYPLLLKRCYETIREADPTAKVLGISTAGIDQAFIKQCLEAGAPFDILTIHPYRTALSDRGFMKELKETSRLVNGRPVWITEMGWSTQMGATTEREQAVLLARCYLAATASGACDNVSWYNFRNDGNDPRYNEHNFGVIRSDLTPKPGYRALATICSILAGGVPVLDEEFPEPVLAVHGPEGSALWSPSTACEVELELPDGISIWNLMGEPVQFSPENGRAWISVPEGAPVFFIGGKPAPTGELRLPFGIDAVELVKF